MGDYTHGKMGVHKDQHDKPCTGILEKRCQGQKMETKTISHGFNQAKCSRLFCQASGGKITFLELKIEKAQNQTYFSF